MEKRLLPPTYYYRIDRSIQGGIFCVSTPWPRKMTKNFEIWHERNFSTVSQKIIFRMNECTHHTICIYLFFFDKTFHNCISFQVCTGIVKCLISMQKSRKHLYCMEVDSKLSSSYAGFCWLHRIKPRLKHLLIHLTAISCCFVLAQY